MVEKPEKLVEQVAQKVEKVEKKEDKESSPEQLIPLQLVDDKFTKETLTHICRDNKLKGYSTLKKEDLIELINKAFNAAK